MTESFGGSSTGTEVDWYLDRKEAGLVEHSEAGWVLAGITCKTITAKDVGVDDSDAEGGAAAAIRHQFLQTLENFGTGAAQLNVPVDHAKYAVLVFIQGKSGEAKVAQFWQNPSARILAGFPRGTLDFMVLPLLLIKVLKMRKRWPAGKLSWADKRADFGAMHFHELEERIAAADTDGTLKRYGLEHLK